MVASTDIALVVELAGVVGATPSVEQPTSRDRRSAQRFFPLALGLGAKNTGGHSMAGTLAQCAHNVRLASETPCIEVSVHRVPLKRGYIRGLLAEAHVVLRYCGPVVFPSHLHN